LSKRIWGGLLAAAGSLILAAPAFAGFGSTLRLNGDFSFEQEVEGVTNGNTACVVADFDEFSVFGNVTDTSDACTVSIFYGGFAPNKASASKLNPNDDGNAKVSQQVETGLVVSISGPVECTTAPYSGFVVPEKCKANGSVKATEGGVVDTVDQGRINVNCDVGSDAADLSPSPTVDQLQTIQAAFDDRKDVKINSNGKVSIKTKGSQDDGDGCD
jgi:hypothetical protein